MKHNLVLARQASDTSASQLRKDLAKARLHRPLKLIELTELGLISVALMVGCMGVEALMHW
ncbi:MAG: hypothetical protein AAFN79_19805 [Pseudomonadota bacterium]